MESSEKTNFCLSASCYRRGVAGAGHKGLLGDVHFLKQSCSSGESVISWIFFPTLFVFCILAVNASTQPGLK